MHSTHPPCGRRIAIKRAIKRRVLDKERIVLVIL
jgi:hypothetical protein